MIKKAMGVRRKGDVLYCMRQETFHYTHEQDCCDLLIPLTIDPVNPERGLWGMLEKVKLIDNTNYYLEMRSTAFSDTVWVGYYDKNGKYFLKFTGTPTEAILKALCHQEGVEG
jgi:hypothetical protein